MKLHAEKKALAILLSHGEDELSVSINFNACMDCHEFFKSSSQLLGHRIQLHQPKMDHTFTGGRCSCNDWWRCARPKLAATVEEEVPLTTSL